MKACKSLNVVQPLLCSMLLLSTEHYNYYDRLSDPIMTFPNYSPHNTKPIVLYGSKLTLYPFR